MPTPLATAVTALTGERTSRPHSPAGVQQAITAAAQSLGMSTLDLQDAIHDGASLADVARRQGVPLDTLTTAMARALTSLDPPVSPRRAEALVAQVLAPRPRPTAELPRLARSAVELHL